MIPFIPPSAQIQVFLALFASFVFAEFQNVTVDDAVLSGAVVPQYLPYNSVWNQGSNCTVCLVKPDPSRAYNGTWHDTTYIPSNGFTQAIEFTFTGSALYIFFILANNASATTLTKVEFVLDGATAGTYVHEPSTSTNYEYNVPVYVNDSLVLGQHQMRIQPVDSGDHLLILFDYLIYTVDMSSSFSSSSETGTVTITSSPPPSSASSSTSSPPSSSASSRSNAGSSSAAPNIGAIVGGTLGGVAALVIVVVSVLCCHNLRHKRSDDGRSLEGEKAVMDPFIVSREVGPTPLLGTTSSPLAVAGVASKGKADVILATAAMPQTMSAPASSSGSAVLSSNLIEQVELLRDEVSRLRHLQDSNPNTVVLHMDVPPKYSEAEGQEV